MDWKTLKEFLKPDWKRVLVMIMIGIVGSLMWFTAASPPIGITLMFLFLFSPIVVLSTLPLDFKGQDDIQYILMQIVGIILVIIYWYVLSCLIIFIYDKLKSRKK